VPLRRPISALALAVGSLASISSSAFAQITYSSSFSTTGTLSCGDGLGGLLGYKNGSCTSNGNQLFITSAGGQTLTLSFVGVSNVPIFATLGTTFVNLGVIQTTLSGPGSFSFRDMTEPQFFPEQFTLALNIQTALPVFSPTLMYYTQLPNTNTVVSSYSLDCCPLPPKNNAAPPYSLVFANIQGDKLVAGGSANITGVYGLYVAPEPSTVLLMATGFFGVGGVAVSRRRRAVRVALAARSST
jgi:hypothetical protein